MALWSGHSRLRNRNASTQFAVNTLNHCNLFIKHKLLFSSKFDDDDDLAGDRFLPLCVCVENGGKEACGMAQIRRSDECWFTSECVLQLVNCGLQLK